MHTYNQEAVEAYNKFCDQFSSRINRLEMILKLMANEKNFNVMGLSIQRRLLANIEGLAVKDVDVENEIAYHATDKKSRYAYVTNILQTIKDTHNTAKDIETVNYARTHILPMMLRELDALETLRIQIENNVSFDDIEIQDVLFIAPTVLPYYNPNTNGLVQILKKLGLCA